MANHNQQVLRHYINGRYVAGESGRCDRCRL